MKPHLPIGIALCAGLAGACGLPSYFACESDAQCGTGGQCVEGVCAFEDPDCMSGLRYGALAPAQLANECVTKDDGVADETRGESASGSESADESSGEVPDLPGETSDPSDSDTDSTDSADTADTGDIPQDVIAHYTFDASDIDGLSVYDSSPNGFHGTMSWNQPSVTGVLDQALVFDGNDRIDLPADMLGDYAEFTVEFYVQADDSAQGPFAWIVYFGPLDIAELPNFSVFMDFGVGLYGGVGVLWNNDGDVDPLEGTTAIAGDEMWHHVAVSVGNEGIRYYVDHQLQAVSDIVPDLQVPGFDVLYIGGIAEPELGIRGSLDELRFTAGMLEVEKLMPLP